MTGIPDNTPAGKAGLRGSSLVDTLADPDPARSGPSEPAVLELIGGRAVCKDNWKAVVITSRPSGVPKLPVKNWMLFDMQDGPAETTDVSAEHPDVPAESTAACAAWADEVGAVELPGMLEVGSELIGDTKTQGAASKMRKQTAGNAFKLKCVGARWRHLSGGHDDHDRVEGCGCKRNKSVAVETVSLYEESCGSDKHPRTTE